MSDEGTIGDGRYRPQRLLGQGGMGRVMLAEDLELGRLVAVKVMRPQVRANPAAFSRFRREARIQSKVEHPNLIKLFDWDLDAENPFLVMELVPGQDLDDVIEDHGPLDEPALVRLVQEVGSALQALHDAGVLHRDLKPANVMIREDGSAVLMDLGLARAEDLTVLTETGAMVGTPRYTPPEILMGDLWDARADQWQLAETAFHAATGLHTIPGESLPAIGAAAYAGRYQDFPPRDPPLSASLRSALRRALDYDPGARFASCAELIAAVGEDEGMAAPAEATAPPGPAPSLGSSSAAFPALATPVPSAPRPGRSVLALAGLAVLGLGLGGWLASRPVGPPVGVAPAAAPASPGPWAPSCEEAAAEVEALDRLRLRDGAVAEAGGAPLFAVRPDPAVLRQVLPHLPAARRFHAGLAAGESPVALTQEHRSCLAEVDRDLRGRGLPRVYFPALRVAPEVTGIGALRDYPDFTWGPGPVPDDLHGWAAQAVRDHAALLDRWAGLRADLDAWNARRPGDFPDADLEAIPVVAATLNSYRLTGEELRLKDVLAFWEEPAGRRILYPWAREALEQLRRVVHALGRAARAQPEQAVALVRAWRSWHPLTAPFWSDPAWGLPLELHLGGRLDSGPVRLVGVATLVHLAAVEARLGTRPGLVDEALDLLHRTIEDFPPGHEVSDLLLALGFQLVGREVVAADRIPDLLALYEDRVEAAGAWDRAGVAYELGFVLARRFQRERLPPGGAAALAARVAAMLARLAVEGHRPVPGGGPRTREPTSIAESMAITARRLEAYRAEVASGTGG